MNSWNIIVGAICCFWSAQWPFRLLLITIPPTPLPLRKWSSATPNVWYCWGCHCVIPLPGHRDGHVTQAWPIIVATPLHSHNDWSMRSMTLKVWPITVLPGYFDILKHRERFFPSAGGSWAGVTWAVDSLVLPLSCFPRHSEKAFHSRRESGWPGGWCWEAESRVGGRLLVHHWSP